MNDSQFNSSDTRQLRRLQRQAKLAEAERREVIVGLMSSPAGRSYVFDRLRRCHVFATTFTGNGLTSAFAEGERNIGLQELNEIMAHCPDQYVQMMREASDREQANGRSRSGSTESDRSGSDPGRDDSGAGYQSDYDPSLDGEDDGYNGYRQP